MCVCVCVCVKRTSLNPFTDPACKISGLNDALRFGENPFTCQEEGEKRGTNGFRFQISKFNWVFSCHIMTVKGLKVSSVIHARIKARVSARIKARVSARIKARVSARINVGIK